MPTIRLEINASVNGITFSATGHANTMKFSGILVNLDTPSTKPPNGSQGKRIMIPTSTAKAALHTLKHMGVNYTDKLDGHNPTKKVGVIQKAWIDGHDIRVSGIIWKRDFPKAETDLKKKELGMSFEATDIDVEDQNANVWKITSMCFTGASILYKKDAAYFATEALAAAKLRNAASQITITQGGISMAHKNSKEKVPAKKSSKKVAVVASGDDIGSVLVGLTGAFKDMSKELRSMSQSNHAMRSELHLLAAGIQTTDESEEESEEIEAAAESESVEESESSEPVHAGGFPFKKKKKKGESGSESESESMDSESMSADADDSGDLTHMESDEPGEDEDKPGHLNDKATNKGSKTKSEDKVGKEVNEPILGSSIKKLLRAVHELKAARESDKRKIKKLEKQLTDSRVQIKAAAQRTDRKTVSSLGRSILTKGGIDAETIQAAGSKISVEEADNLLANANVDTTTKMAIKTEWARKGIMDEGQVAAIQVN